MLSFYLPPFTASAGEVITFKVYLDYIVSVHSDHEELSIFSRFCLTDDCAGQTSGISSDSHLDFTVKTYSGLPDLKATNVVLFPFRDSIYNLSMLMQNVQHDLYLTSDLTFGELIIQVTAPTQVNGNQFQATTFEMSLIEVRASDYDSRVSDYQPMVVIER